MGGGVLAVNTYAAPQRGLQGGVVRETTIDEFSFGTRVLGLALRGATFSFDFYLAISNVKRQLCPLTSSKLAYYLLIFS